MPDFELIDHFMDKTACYAYFAGRVRAIAGIDPMPEATRKRLERALAELEDKLKEVYKKDEHQNDERS